MATRRATQPPKGCDTGSITAMTVHCVTKAQKSVRETVNGGSVRAPLV